jgi:uncharacterized protein
MNVNELNRALLEGRIEDPQILPRLHALENSTFKFGWDFGLENLPTTPGVLLVRGARQYGKSTWMESEIRRTIQEHGAGSALFLDGDHAKDEHDLSEKISEIAGLFHPDAPVRRLFIDEITSIDDWERALKRPLDRGELARVLVVTTGSRASDLRRGFERLPGRKGRLERTQWIFTPLSYSAFLQGSGRPADPDSMAAYLLTGGSPVACAEIAAHGRIPSWVVETTRDWILGECAREGRHRRSLIAVMEQLHRLGASPVGQNKLAKEAGLTNNTVAAGYVELLADLLVLGISGAWDANRKVEVARRPAKYPFVNLLAAVAWAPEAPRTVADFRSLAPSTQGIWLEWLAAQEMARRRAIGGAEDPQRLPYWSQDGREIDFVDREHHVEAKRGKTSPTDFTWFPKSFPGRHLWVVGESSWKTDFATGVDWQDFLQGAGPLGN